MKAYFNEETVSDIDFTGLEDFVQRYIEKRFRLVRSKGVRFSAFDHQINLCLISNVKEDVEEEKDEKKDEKDEKLKVLLKSNQIYTKISKYQYYFKVYLSAVSVILQENGKLRFVYVHKSNYLLLSGEYEMK